MRIHWIHLLALSSLSIACGGGATGNSNGTSDTIADGGPGDSGSVPDSGTSSNKAPGATCAVPTPAIAGTLTDAEAAKLFAAPPKSTDDYARTGLFQSGAMRIRIANGSIQFAAKRGDGSAWGVKSNIGGWSKGATDSGTFVVLDAATNVDSTTCTNTERSMVLEAGVASFYSTGTPGRFTLRVPFASSERVCCQQGNDFRSSDLDIARIGD